MLGVALHWQPVNKLKQCAQHCNPEACWDVWDTCPGFVVPHLLLIGTLRLGHVSLLVLALVLHYASVCEAAILVETSSCQGCPQWLVIWGLGKIMIIREEEAQNEWKRSSDMPALRVPRYSFLSSKEHIEQLTLTFTPNLMKVTDRGTTIFHENTRQKVNFLGYCLAKVPFLYDPYNIENLHLLSSGTLHEKLWKHLKKNYHHFLMYKYCPCSASPI